MLAIYRLNYIFILEYKMSKILTKTMAQELQQEFASVNSFILVNYTGLSAQQTHELRSSFFEQNIKMRVVKNTILVAACGDKLPDEIDSLLKGPTAVVYGGESIVSVAKALVDWKKKQPNINIKGGYIPGRLLNDKDVTELSKIPPREVLLSMLAGLFEAPLQQIATIMNAPLQDISNAMNGVVDKMEEAGSDNVANAVAE